MRDKIVLTQSQLFFTPMRLVLLLALIARHAATPIIDGDAASVMGSAFVS